MSRLTESFLATCMLGGVMVGIMAAHPDAALPQVWDTGTWLTILRGFFAGWWMIYGLSEGFIVLQSLSWVRKRRSAPAEALLPMFALATPSWRRVGPRIALFTGAPLLLAGQMRVIEMPYMLLSGCVLLIAVTLSPHGRGCYRKVLRKFHRRCGQRGNAVHSR